ncbi:EamA family transporter [Tenacibaculum tangerinum]|uniref:EamA family transporter n=1 Tax=Tenacibaculum tangerinum TaxID=3038772 RepID=A0ABY8L4Z4_9FLAO|nr:EamA family transporter [Tenacibaculum tangerinum]WGH76496.1 EamA family transporter [Tenacibaculum tangerinum]
MKESKPLIIAAFIAIYIIWGSTYLLNKIVVTEVPPLLLAATRFSLSGILIMLIAIFLKVPIKATKKQLVNAAIAAFLFLIYGNGVFVWALKYVDSGFAALLAATQPLFVLLLLRLVDGKKMQAQSIIGVVLGITGMYLLVSQNEITTSKDTLRGVLMIFSCILSWSYGSIFVAKARLPKNFFVSTSYQMLIAGIFLFIASLLLNEPWSSPIDWSLKAQGSMVLLIVFGSIVAFTSFNYLLKVVSAEKVSTSAYVNPVVALFLGWWFLDETLTTQSIIASIVLLSGVYFITSRKRISKLKVNSKPQKV